MSPVYLATAVELSGWSVGGALFVWLVTAALSAAASTYIAVRILRTQMDSVLKSLQTVTAAVTEHDNGINRAALERARLINDRSQCELRAAHTYATRGELARLMNDQAGAFAVFGDKIDGLHGRVTRVAEGLGRIEGRLEAEGKART